jgi:hypothetical protein
MPTPAEAAQALRVVALLAEEQGDALDRAFRLFGDGALLGPRAVRLHAGLTQRRQEVGLAFTRAFHEVELLATARGDPQPVPPPRLRRPPEPLREPPGGFVGGDPDLMQAIDAELAHVSRAWQNAGQVLAVTLVRLGLDSSPGQDVARAGEWLDEQRPDLRRRREELLKTTPPPQPPPQSGWDAFTGAVTGAVAKVGAFWSDAVSHVVPGGAPRQYTERVAVPFTQGVAEAVIGAARFGWEHSLGGLVANPSTVMDTVQAAQEAGEQAAEHPVEFAKSVVDWDTLTTDPARWFGRLVPEVLLGGRTVATRAGRAAVRGPRLPDGSPIPPPRTAADGPPLPTISMRREFVESDRRKGVRYLSPEDLESKRLIIHDGKIYDVNGKPFDTADAQTHFSGTGHAIFVMDRHGNIYAHGEHTVGSFHHSSFLRGGDVAAAGELEVRNGVLKAISRKSGHYWPGPETLQRVVDRLRSAGVSFDGVERRGYSSG